MQPIVYFCGFHHTRLKTMQGRSMLYYACPKYKKDGRAEGEKVCTNHVSRKAIKQIKEDLEYQKSIGNLILGYEGVIRTAVWGTRVKRVTVSGTEKRVYYKVLELNEDYIGVGIISERRGKKYEDELH